MEAYRIPCGASRAASLAPVPGGTVLFMMTTDPGSARSPIVSITERTKRRSAEPVSVEGVPTATIAMPSIALDLVGTVRM